MLNKIPDLPFKVDEKPYMKGSNPEQDFKQMLRSMNLKITEQRMNILRTLHTGHVHVTAQQLFELVTKKDPTLGFATVYRFLRRLTDAGIVTEVRMGGQPARYEMATSFHHDHLTCSRCGKICEFENDEIEKLQIQVAESFGFKLTNHVLELYGICSACQRRNIAR